MLTVSLDTDDYVRGNPASHANLYVEDYRTHDEYQYRIKDKVRRRIKHTPQTSPCGSHLSHVCAILGRNSSR